MKGTPETAAEGTSIQLGRRRYWGLECQNTDEKEKQIIILPAFVAGFFAVLKIVKTRLRADEI